MKRKRLKMDSLVVLPEAFALDMLREMAKGAKACGINVAFNGVEITPEMETLPEQTAESKRKILAFLLAWFDEPGRTDGEVEELKRRMRAGEEIWSLTGPPFFG